MKELVKAKPYLEIEDWSNCFLESLLNLPKSYVFFQRSKTHINCLIYILIHAELCRRLLLCYLQNASWSAALQVSRSFSNRLSLEYSVEDCFAVACLLTYYPETLLKNYKFNSSTSIESYAFVVLKRRIKREISKSMKPQGIKKSDYHLICSLSPRKLEKHLEQVGFTTETKKLFILICLVLKKFFQSHCFYNNQGKLLTNPPEILSLKPEELNHLIEAYNQRLRQSELSISSVTLDEFKKKLEIFSQLIINLDYIEIVSWEDRQFKLDLIDESLTDWTNLEQQTELNNIVIKEFNILNDINTKKALVLWLGMGISQQYLCSFLQVERQYQVTRKFQGIYKKILKEILNNYYFREVDYKLIQQNRSSLINSQLRDIRDILKLYAENLFRDILSQVAINVMSQEDYELLWGYSHEPNFIELLSLNPDLSKKVQHLEQHFIMAVAGNLAIDLIEFADSQQRILCFIAKNLRHPTILNSPQPARINTDCIENKTIWRRTEFQSW